MDSCPRKFFIVGNDIFAASICVATECRTKSKSFDLLRYNAATTFISNGIPRSVASAILGHGDPSSLDYYTFADLTHLRECALSIENFPVRGV